MSKIVSTGPMGSLFGGLLQKPGIRAGLRLSPPKLSPPKTIAIADHATDDERLRWRVEIRAAELRQNDPPWPIDVPPNFSGEVMLSGRPAEYGRISPAETGERLCVAADSLSAGCLADGVELLVGHNPRLRLATTADGSLRAWIDRRGLCFAAWPEKHNEYLARHALLLIRQGRLGQLSHGLLSSGPTIDGVRIVERYIRVHEISLTSTARFPALTSSGGRHLSLKDIRQQSYIDDALLDELRAF